MFFDADVDYNRTEPCMIRETAHWAVVYKPPHLPTAPIRVEERNTLVYWFLHSAEAGVNDLSGDMQRDVQEPAAEYGRHIREVQAGNRPEMPTAGQRIRAAQVRGKKAIEAGLLHRLDTDTRGLVLFAKDQATYDFLAARQEAGLIVKTYCAFVEPCAAADNWRYTSGNTSRFNLTGLSAAKTPTGVDRIAGPAPYTLVSQFRNFGPGAKRVAPVFFGSRHYKKDGRLYTTVIDAADILPSLPAPIDENDRIPQTVCGYSPFKNDCKPSPFQPTSVPPLVRIRCRLSRGYRHQVRAHLASVGLPIAGDPLYAPQEPEAAHGTENTGVGLQLYAIKLEFPDPENPQRNICVALPPPDRMNP